MFNKNSTIFNRPNMYSFTIHFRQDNASLTSVKVIRQFRKVSKTLTKTITKI